MTYWNKQPLDIINDINYNDKKDKNNKIDKNDTHIKIINNNPQLINIILPNGFKFKTLNVSHLDKIHSLINNHYVCDDQQIVRLTYSRDFLYWYISNIPLGYIVGLVYENKLVGMITSIFIDMIVYGEKLSIPYINFLCVQKTLRLIGLAPMLINEMKNRLVEYGFKCGLFSSNKCIPKSFCSTIGYVVPINYTKLNKIGFLTEREVDIIEIDNNPLHLMNKSDIDQVLTGLNFFMEKLLIKPHFTTESLNHFMLPKKNIVYSFVVKDLNGKITDFVCVYKHYLYCIDHKKMIVVANLAFYYNNSMQLTQLIKYLLDKLRIYGFDQLVFRNTFDNSNINITKFCTQDILSYYFYNVSVHLISASEMCFYPF